MSEFIFQCALRQEKRKIAPFVVQEHIQNITKRSHPHNSSRQWLSVRWLSCAQLFTDTIHKEYIHRTCYFCSLRFLFSDAHSMRPTPVWYHELKNRLFWWLVTKKTAGLFFSGRNHIWCCRGVSQAAMSAEIPLPALCGSTAANCEYTPRLHKLTVTAPPHCQSTFNSRCGPTIQLYWKCHAQMCIFNVASTSFCASTFFLLCFRTWDQPPSQQFRIREESHGNYLMLYGQC